jgi:hypothetical protein
MRTLTQVERAHKARIRTGDEPGEMAMRRIHLLLLAVFAEARLRKIIDDPTGFDAHERALIWTKQSQEQRWTAAVDLAARKHYQIGDSPDLESSLPPTARQRIRVTKSLLKGELSPVITDRNKLAHGQWVWQLRSKSDEEFVSTPRVLDFNYSALMARYTAIENIARLVHTLCVSEPTFDRDFESIFDRISSALNELDGHAYSAFAADLVRRHQTGLSKRGGDPRV